MKYSVVLEHDPETGHLTGTVSGLPIFVDAKSRKEALRLAREAIKIFLEGEASGHVPHPERPVRAEVVKVEVHAKAAR